MLLIYSVAALFRMGNWTQNDTYRAAGDPIYGTVLEIVFMFLWYCRWSIQRTLLCICRSLSYLLCATWTNRSAISLRSFIFIPENGSNPCPCQYLAALPEFREKHGIKSKTTLTIRISYFYGQVKVLLFLGIFQDQGAREMFREE